ncbi:MAG: secondary thiamine-phosphate synthase enzyme YjbQ [Proteobacteria bacterium]|nr:secondary thiamine-phosphate synthase enzyme YjbQ [Pseudomonadota bacterium]
MEKISIKTTKRTEIVDITGEVLKIVSKIGISDGICVIFCPHTTAGVGINENADPTVKQDILSALSKLVPQNAGYRHLESNSDAHIKNILIGPSLSLIIESGRLALGTWQGIFFIEGDGPRQREVWVKIIGK